MTQTISLAMIVRDEEANLMDCLNSVRGEVDEIVIVDTGSIDQTQKIAGKFTDKCYSYEWNGDFSAARNFAISKCTGQWILCLDADEKLDSQNGSIRQLITGTPDAEVFCLPLLTCAATEYERFSVVRLFRNTAEYRFVGKIHEQILITKANVVGIADAPVIWHKFMTHKKRNKKRYRNLRLLQQALQSDSDNYYLKYYMGVEWLGIGRYEKALACFQEAVAHIGLDRLMFRGPAVRYLVDCLKFLGRQDEAFKVCQTECELNPDYTDIFFDAGAILEEQGEFKKAIDYFHKAIQLGSPPLMFYHSKGTESFLAFYHLGFCYEKIGCYELAENYYWQALDSNPGYVCPLYSLFLLKTNSLKPSDVFVYFKNNHSFAHDQWVETLAKLFFAVGMPELAAECYEQSLTFNADASIHRIKSLLYSGCVQQALHFVNSIEKAKIPVDIAVEEIVAYMLNTDYNLAKQRALELWAHSPTERSKAWALLSLIARLDSGTGYTKPEKSRESEVIQTYLTIIENCLRFKPKYPDHTVDSSAFKKLAKTAVEILTGLSPESNMCLIDYARYKAETVRSMLYYQYPSTRGLYL